jgi:hypothetical protein
MQLEWMRPKGMGQAAHSVPEVQLQVELVGRLSLVWHRQHGMDGEADQAASLLPD